MNNSISSILSGLDTLRDNHPPQTRSHFTVDTRVEISKLLSALNSYNECVRYLNTRRSAGALLNIDSEAAVQDVLYIMLRPWINDLVSENPTEKVANRYSIKDFVSQSNRFVLEAKYVRSVEHGKSISKELNDDIENYRYHAHCDDLIFFIYDPDGFIPDGGALERHLTSNRTYGDRILRCHAIIKP